MLEFYPCFPVNDQLNQTNYYLFNKGFDDVQVKYILEIAKQYDADKGTISNNNLEDGVYRKSKVSWLPPEENKTEWIYEVIMDYVMSANFNLWKFDINHFKDSIQYSEYHADDNDHYDWHIDLGPYPVSTRKISIVVQLSDPDEYEGGDFQIKTSNDEETLVKSKGSVVMFPSYLMHRVTPVTKGVRKSLVLWVGGSVFR